MENWWAIAGTLLGALIAGSAALLNSVYSAKSTLKRENRNRLIEEKERDVKELETLYQDILHSLDKLIRRLGSLETNELEKYYKMEIRMELISTKEIVDKLNTVSNDISKMASKLPKMPEEFIPKFEEDYERQSRLNNRKKAKEERKEKAEEFIPQIRKEYNKLSELMKVDLQKRRILEVDEYVEYRKKN
jgi:gas vesicle protein